MNAVLVATDLSSRSDRAVDRAFAVARETGARVIVLCVVDEDIPSDIAGKFADDAKARLDAFIRAIPLAREVEWEARVVIGDVQRDVQEAADSERADLIVLGLHRRRPFLDLFRGTTMERLVRASARPVLLVKEPADHDYRTVLAGIDLSPACGAALRAVKRVAPRAAIHAIHAYHVPFKGFIGGDGGGDPQHKAYREEAEAELDAWLKSEPGLPDGLAPELIEGAVQAALDRKLVETRPDLIAVGAHGRSTLSPTLLGGLTTELLRDPPCDLLIVRR